ncbi:maleylpyruvate isomerase N-terminal domain-containing protein [Microbacterium sp. ARD31]|uniref:maleylpyruvate isomerase N-terminal domain-containing protein n=1 Tax=Microbacterium sp. ARD31 TaxID=2962576 RepID=UPI0028829C07|nr:maleylpyruvate isomerase N-terminal domain-containing protein [Microbacterium sp. ARD31]MDT0186216.1 maleylpyruvate isomerase N-terminal domain-containing protein [Microbacterium sp. ARD31]
MSWSWVDSRSAYADATTWFVDTAGLVGGRWSQPGLGEWDVRSLVGHTSRALLTVESYLDRPAGQVDVESALEYFRRGRRAADDAAVAERGRAAGEALGTGSADVAEEVAAIADRVLARVERCHGEEVVTTIAGGMRLVDYLPTRTFELVVHTADLATALGVPAEPPPRPAAQALDLLAGLAVQEGVAARVLRAATGREGLPAGFSVL